MLAHEGPCRHDWVYLTKDWRRHLAAPLTVEGEDALAGWMVKRRPLVVARKREDDAASLLRLGLALPGRRRFCVAVAAEAMERRRGPPDLLEVIHERAAFWPQAMSDLRATATRVAAKIHVFGSFAWRFFAADSSYDYLTTASDLDLLLRPADAAQLNAAIAWLTRFERSWPAPRIDGEIALPDGDFVSWREYSARPRKILAKGDVGVRLRAIEDIDALFSASVA